MLGPDAQTDSYSHVVCDTLTDLRAFRLPCRLYAVYVRADTGPTEDSREYLDSFNAATALRNDVHDPQTVYVKLRLHNGPELAGEWLVSYFPRVEL
jgi:hypothetical protein